MNYEIEMNEQGQFDGYQSINYKLGKSEVTECQKWKNGTFVKSFVIISRFVADQIFTYTFDSKDWGTPELTRDAAEGFAIGQADNVIDVEDRDIFHRNCLPMVDDTFVMEV